MDVAAPGRLLDALIRMPNGYRTVTGVLERLAISGALPAARRAEATTLDDALRLPPQGILELDTVQRAVRTFLGRLS